MELPKNITQVGETNHRCKIYVEDYVISYMKQLNQAARDKDMAVALYGVRKEENDVSYLFLYGACKLNFLQKETRHLSQAQQQEIEKCREKYFRNYDFLGYRLLNGEMLEGFHVCEQDICRYIAGYAQFYEKNDSMLAYMLDVREEKQPEVVPQEKYEEVKKRQEERREHYTEQVLRKPVGAVREEARSAGNTGNVKMMRFAVVAVFALLCFAGLQSIGEEGGWENLQAKAEQALSSIMEQQIPDAMSEDTLVAEDKLADAILQENETAIPVQGEAEAVIAGTEPIQNAGDTAQNADAASMEVKEPIANSAVENMPVEPPTVENTPIEAAPTESLVAEQPVEAQPIVEQPIVEQPVETQPIVEQPIVEQPVDTQPAVTEAAYIIQEGDTLIGISVQNYGNDERVAEICALNQIANPDDIKVGQKILLP